jgi:hypothetical protein
LALVVGMRLPDGRAADQLEPDAQLVGPEEFRVEF